MTGETAGGRSRVLEFLNRCVESIDARQVGRQSPTD
jgi:hypothetical protein